MSTGFDVILVHDAKTRVSTAHFFGRGSIGHEQLRDFLAEHSHDARVTVYYSIKRKEDLLRRAQGNDQLNPLVLGNVYDFGPMTADDIVKFVNEGLKPNDPVYSRAVDLVASGAATEGFTRLDWLKLAQLAVDQAIVPPKVQDQIADLLGIEALKYGDATMPESVLKQ